MPSLEQTIVNNRVIIQASITSKAGEGPHLFSALLDTGAQITAISPRVVSELGLLPTGKRTLVVASGQVVEVLEFCARVDLPIDHLVTSSRETRPFLMGQQLFVAGLPYQPGDHDVIFGMDFLGSFHITLFKGKVILSN